MSDYEINWSKTDIDGKNEVSGAQGSVGFSVSTPENINHDQWAKGSVDGTDGLKVSGVCNETSVKVAFDEAVSDVAFDLIDLDSVRNCFDDRITIIAKDVHGNILPVTFSGLNGNQTASDGVLNASGGALQAGDHGHIIGVHIAGPVASIEVISNNGGGADVSGNIGLGNVSFAPVAGDGDGYVDGTSGNDTIDVAYTGDRDGDVIDGGDAVLPGAGANDDVVLAGAGDDFVVAGAGDDEIYGGDGDDTLCGVDGDDVIFGGAGNDILEGMNNDDVLFGGKGADYIMGDANNDVISGGTGNDKLFGGTGDDLVSGGKGNDTIETGAGNDVAYGGAGSDNIDGGAGNDVLVGGNMTYSGTQTFNELDAGDLIEGQYVGEGFTISSANPKTPVMVFDTANPTGGDRDLATDNLGKVLILSEDRDESDPDDNAHGGTFNITFEAPATVTGMTLLDVEEGATVTYYDTNGAVLEVVHVQTANNGQYELTTNLSGVGHIEVELEGSGAIDNLSYAIKPGTDDGADVITGGAGDDIIYGNAGDDVLSGDAGADQIFGGSGSDTILGGAGDTVDGGGFGNDNDVLDLTGQGPYFLKDVVSDDKTGGNGNGFSGTVVFVDDKGVPTGETLTFTDIEVVQGEEFNRPPSAGDDTATVNEDGSVKIDVLANDSDPDGDALSIASADSPNGTVTINGDGTITFVPDENFFGEATITYTVDDGQGGTDTATVLVNVTAVNDNPVAVDERFSVGQNDPSDDVDGNVLVNDSDVDGDTIRVIEVSNGTNEAAISNPFGSLGSGASVAGDNGGVFTINNGGNILFDPADEFDYLAEGETATSSVTYTISDPSGATDTATVTFTITGTNDAPVAVNDSDETDFNTAITVDLLENDSDVDGDTLSVIDATVPASQGTLVDNGDGTATFTPAAGFVGVATISYTIADEGGLTASAIHTVVVSASPLDGTVTGTEGDDIIDTTYLGDPDGDVVDGNDAIIGDVGSNDDIIEGRSGDDVINAGDGDDTVFGGADNDEIFGGAGTDTLFGGRGDDLLDGGSGDDSILGGSGNDSIIGGSGDDTIGGGNRADVIDAGSGNDYVDGGDGDDIIDTSGHAPLPDLSYGTIVPADGVTITLADGTKIVTSPTDDLDTVFGGDGNDTITTGDDADFVDGGEGDDRIDGGIDNDELIGGAGDDVIIGGEGSDSISGGDGNDTIFAGIEPGETVLPDVPGAPFIPEQIADADDPEPDNGDDLVFGGAGDDVIFGADDSDVLYGDEGNDTLDGEIDDDTLFGGAGNDTLTGGEGADEAFGGTGSDLFLGGQGGDTVVGGEDADGSDVDVLDLTGSNVDFITYEDNDPEAGTVTFIDGSTMTFAEIENVIPCFTPGTTIATPKGERLVEELREGDRIITRDNGIQEIRWVGRKEMSGKALQANPHLKPILVRAGSLGNGLPERDMLVSPNHRMLVASDKTQLYFEEREVLAAAKHMVGSDGIHAVDVMGTAYIHFMFDRHEVVLSNGAWTESFQPGDYSLKGLGNSQRNEIFELFPELTERKGLEGYHSARRALKKHEARLLVK